MLDHDQANAPSSEAAADANKPHGESAVESVADPDFDRLPGDGLPEPDASLTSIAVRSAVCVVVVVVASWQATRLYFQANPERYVVDFYPASETRPPVAVVRWLSRQVQLEPVELPAALASSRQWNGNRPKRTTLEPESILPAGDVIEYDETDPPGRYVIRMGERVIEVSPASDWYRGDRREQGETGGAK